MPQPLVALLPRSLPSFFAERQSPRSSRVVRRQLRPYCPSLRPVTLSPCGVLPGPPLQLVRSRPLLRLELLVSTLTPSLPLLLQKLSPPLRIGPQFFIPPLPLLLLGLRTHAALLPIRRENTNPASFAVMVSAFASPNFLNRATCFGDASPSRFRSATLLSRAAA